MKNFEDESMQKDSPASTPSYSAWKGAAIMVGLIIAFYVLREHWGHVLGFAPYLILLACPLMHLFMHGNHGHGHSHSQNDEKHEK